MHKVSATREYGGVFGYATAENTSVKRYKEHIAALKAIKSAMRFYLAPSYN
jgi:hypothetical protein